MYRYPLLSQCHPLLDIHYSYTPDDNYAFALPYQLAAHVWQSCMFTATTMYTKFTTVALYSNNNVWNLTCTFYHAHASTLLSTINCHDRSLTLYFNTRMQYKITLMTDAIVTIYRVSFWFSCKLATVIIIGRFTVSWISTDKVYMCVHISSSTDSLQVGFITVSGSKRNKCYIR